TAFLDQIIHGDCIAVMRTMPGTSIDFVLTDPPYLARYVGRDGRSIANDRNDSWLRPAFAEIYRVLKPDRFCVSFYGWHQVERFMGTWKQIGFVPVSHFSFVKGYASRARYTRSFHEN